MPDNALQFTIGLGLTGDEAVKGVQQVRDRLRSALDEFKNVARNIDAFSKLTDELGNTGKALGDITTKMAALKASLAQTGDSKNFKQLNTDLTTAQAAFADLTTKAEQQRASLNDLDASLFTTQHSVEAVTTQINALRTALSTAERGTNTFNTLNADLRTAEAAAAGLAAQEDKLAAQNRVLTEQFAQTQASLRVTTEQIGQLQTALSKSGNLQAIKDIEKDLAGAQREFAALTARQEQQQKSLAALNQTLAATGIDTQQLASAEAALAEQAAAATQAVELQDAKQRLGLVTTRDVQAQISALRADYQLLAESGTLSFTELQQAQAAFAARSAELAGANGTLAGSLKGVALELLGLYVAFQQVGSAIGESIRVSADFGVRIAEVESIAQTSKAAVQQLAEQVRELSRTMGIDATDAVRGLYDIVSSGIPADNAFSVLAQSSKAAIAGLTDLQTTAKLGVQALNAFGLPAGKLGEIFDKLFLTVRDGVVRFDELSHVFGNLFPAARSTGTSLEELGAAIVVLTRNGLEAPEAVTALNQSLSHLASPTAEARAAMQDLGITYNGFIGTVQQLAEKNLSLQQMRTLIPDIRAAKGLISLASSAQLLTQEVKILASESGAVEKAYQIISNTPEFNLRRLSQAFEDLKRNIGDYLNSSGGLVVGLTQTINAFNNLDPSARSAVAQVGAFGTVALVAAAAVRVLGPVVSTLNASLAAVGLSAGRAALAFGTFEAAFSFGQSFYQSDTLIRRLGDSLGTLAGAFVETARKSSTFGENLTVDLGSLISLAISVGRNKEAQQALREALSDTTGQLRLQEQQQASLRKQISDTTLTAQSQITGVREAIALVGNTVSAQLERSHTAIINLTTDLTNLGGDFKALAADVKTTLDASLANIDAQTTATVNSIKLQQAATGEARLSELAALKLEAKAYADAAAEKLKIIGDANTQAIVLFEKEASARIAKAVETGANLKRVERDIALDRLSVYQGTASELQKVLDGLTAREQARNTQVIGLIEERKQFEIKASADLAALYREGLEPYRQVTDLRFQIDTLYFKAKQELAHGDLKAFDTYIGQINGLIKQESQEVKDGTEVIVDKVTAVRNATSDQERVNNLIRDSFKLRATEIAAQQEIEKAAIDKTKESLSAVRDIVTDLAKEAQKKIAVLIEFDDAKFKKDLLALDSEIETRARLMPIDAETHAINAKIAEISNKIATGQTFEIKDNISDVRARIEVLRQDLSGQAGLAGNFDAATKKLDELAASSDKLSGLDASLRGTSAQIAEINKQFADLSQPITKEIRVKVVNDATGAPVAVPVDSLIPQGFASGGPVGMGEGGTVPGTGHSDTVASLLRGGSFVINRSASDYYQQSMLGRLAHFASGGPVVPLAGSTNTYIQLPGDNKKPPDRSGINRPDLTTGFEIGPALRDSLNLPSDKAALEKLIFGYIGQVKSYALSEGPYWLNALATVDKDIAWYRKTGSQDGLIQAMNDARYVGLNLGESRGRHDGFDVDGKRFHYEGRTNPHFGFDPTAMAPTWSFYAKGGAAKGDTVPAMLTPKEFVFTPEAVANYGTDFMHALNSRAIPRDALAWALGGKVQAFADGGYVASDMYNGISSSVRAVPASAAAASVAAMSNPGGGLSITINHVGAMDGDFVNRTLVPAIRDIQRRSRSTLSGS